MPGHASEHGGLGPGGLVAQGEDVRDDVVQVHDGEPPSDHAEGGITPGGEDAGGHGRGET